MRILVIGSGAREHAICRAFARSPKAKELFCCGTSINPGIRRLCSDYWTGDISDCPLVVGQAIKWKVDLVIIGPEAPLEKGLADALTVISIPVVGPGHNLAKIESSKGYARDLMAKYEIPGLPRFRRFENINGIEDYLKQFHNSDYVIKANGLMGGKGVKVGGEHLHNHEEALAYCREIFAEGQSLVVEEKLIGQEFSLMCFSDGTTVVPMPIVQDHKRAYENDTGPNTGGMGSYSDVDHSLPFLQEQDVEQAMAINAAVIKALYAEEGKPYRGILYGGFMATSKGVYVIEFNARFGDPEALNVLSLLETDFIDICQAIPQGTLNKLDVKFISRASVCKYVVPEGYPDKPVKNEFIDISAVKDDEHLYLASVDERSDGELVALGSRTAAYVGVEDNIIDAEKKVEEEIAKIEGPLFHRKDIGTRELIEHRIELMRKLRQRPCI